MAIDPTTDTDAVDRTTWYSLPRYPDPVDLDWPISELHLEKPDPDGPDDLDAWRAFFPDADTEIADGQFITIDPENICILDDRYR